MVPPPSGHTGSETRNDGSPISSLSCGLLSLAWNVGRFPVYGYAEAKHFPRAAQGTTDPRACRPCSLMGLVSEVSALKCLTCFGFEVGGG